jgi:hypothetical protein
MKNILILVLAFSFALGVVTGCDNIKTMTADDVSLVKSGTLEIDKSLTVGQAIDNYKYFKRPIKWESAKSENGKRLVNVTASIDTAAHPLYNSHNMPKLKQLDIKLQFIINRDNTFQIGGCGIGLEKTNGEKIEDSDLTTSSCGNRLQQIYNNSPAIYNLDGLV